MESKSVSIGGIQHIKNLEATLPSYTVFLLDMWGVLYDGCEALPGALEAVQHMEKAGKKMIVLSNNPRPSHLMKRKLLDLGFPVSLEAITSGDVTRSYIQTKYPGKKIFHLGQHKNQDLFFDQADLLVSDLCAADLVVVSLFTEQNESNEAFLSQLDDISKSGLPVLCSNPDVSAPHGGETRKTAGFYAQYLEEKGVPVVYMGKPDALIYEIIWDRFGFCESDKAKALMVGDTAETDILGANQFGLDSLLVLSGNTGRGLASFEECAGLLEGLPVTQKPTYVSETI